MASCTTRSLELDVLTGRRPHRHLHARTTSTRISSSAFPNSYGTLGYALQLTATHDAGQALRARRSRSTTPTRASFFAALARALRRRERRLRRRRRCSRRDDWCSSRGRFVDEAPYVSDYTYEHIYYRSLRERARRLPDDARLPVALGHRLVLVLEERRRAESAGAPAAYGRKRLGLASRTRRSCAGTAAGRDQEASSALRGVHSESVIQDVDIPIARAAEFLEFLRARDRHPADLDLPDPAPDASADGYRSIRCRAERWYVNFGFWDVMRIARAASARATSTAGSSAR